jgi:hypothetical protein
MRIVTSLGLVAALALALWLGRPRHELEAYKTPSGPLSLAEQLEDERQHLDQIRWLWRQECAIIKQEVHDPEEQARQLQEAEDRVMPEVRDTLHKIAKLQADALAPSTQEQEGWH